MKRALMGAIALCAVSLPATADYVYVSINGDKERFDVGDRAETSVCALKLRVADAADMKVKKFELVNGGIKLNENKTLKGANVMNGITLAIKPVSHSFQCD